MNWFYSHLIHVGYLLDRNTGIEVANNRISGKPGLFENRNSAYFAGNSLNEVAVVPIDPYGFIKHRLQHGFFLQQGYTVDPTGAEAMDAAHLAGNLLDFTALALVHGPHRKKDIGFSSTCPEIRALLSHEGVKAHLCKTANHKEKPEIRTRFVVEAQAIDCENRRVHRGLYRWEAT